MALFKDNTDRFFRITDEKELERLVNFFTNAYNAEQLTSYVSDIWPIISHFEVVKNGKVTKFFQAGEKPYSFRKNKLATICAMVHCCPENLAIVIDKTPAYLKAGMAVIILNGYAGEDLLKEADASELLEKHDMLSWYRSDSRAKYMEIHGLKNSISRYKERFYENYAFVAYHLRSVYGSVLFKDLTSRSFLSDDAGDGNITVCAEKEFVTSFPVIADMHAQDLIKNNGTKISSAAAAKTLKSTTIPDIIPEQVGTSSKINVGQYFIPVLSMALDKSGTEDMTACLRLAVEYLKSDDPVHVMPYLLPHLKGFRANYLTSTKAVRWCIRLCEYMTRNPDKWIDIQNFRDFLFVHVLDESSGCPLNPNDFGRMQLTNTLSGNRIYIDSQRNEIDTELIRAIAASMYGMGVAEIAMEATGKSHYDTPCGRIRKVRLTLPYR